MQTKRTRHECSDEVNWEKYVAHLDNEIKTDGKSGLGSKYLKSRLAYELTKTTQSSVSRAYEVWDNFIATLLKFDNPPLCKRYAMQIKIHRRMIACLAALVFRTDFVTERANIMKKYRMSLLCTQIFIMTPRRFGKTECASMLAAAAFVCIPNVKIGIVANTVDAAGKDGMLGVTKKYAEYLLPKKQTKRKADNESHLTVEFAPNDIRTITSYTDSEKLRFVCTK